MDIGGHRFFSKSDRVLQGWLNVLPLDTQGAIQPTIRYQGALRSVPVGEAGPAPQGDGVMPLRPRRSRIYFQGRLFACPIALTLDTLGKLGPMTVVAGIVAGKVDRAAVWEVNTETDYHEKRETAE